MATNNSSRRASSRRSKQPNRLSDQLNKQAAAADVVAATTANRQQIGQNSQLSLSTLPRGINLPLGQQQTGYITNAPVGSREQLMGDTKFRDNLGNATVECNNTGIYKWPFDQQNINLANSIDAEKFCPTYKFQSSLNFSAICYMTYAFFLEKGNVYNNIYNPLPTSKALSVNNYSPTNKSHIKSLLSSNQGNTLVRLECEHVIPFDEMLFYFGCSSNKWYNIADQLISQFQKKATVSSHKTKITILYNYSPEQLVLNINNGVEFVKLIHKYIYDFSIALANQWKSNNKIIKIQYNTGNLTINLKENIYDELLQCIFIDGNHNQLNPPNSGPWKSLINGGSEDFISFKSMKDSRLYDDLKFFVPGDGGGRGDSIKELSQLDLNDTNPTSDYNIIKESSKQLLRDRCEELGDKIKNEQNYGIYQKFYVNVIIQAIYEISKIVNISSLISRRPLYLKYVNIYRILFNLPTFSFMQYPVLTNIQKQELLAAVEEALAAEAATASATSAIAQPPTKKLKVGGGNVKRGYDESNESNEYNSLTFNDINKELMDFINQPINDTENSIKLIDLIELYLTYDNDEEFKSNIGELPISAPAADGSQSLIENPELYMDMDIEIFPTENLKSNIDPQSVLAYGGKLKKKKKKKKKKSIKKKKNIKNKKSIKKKKKSIKKKKKSIKKKKKKSIKKK